MDRLTRLRPERRTSVEAFAGLVDRRSQVPMQIGPSPSATAGPLDELVGLTERISGAGRALDQVAGPSAEFRGALRTRLLAVAAVQGVGSPAAPPVAAAVTTRRSTSWRTSRRGQRTLGVAAASLASVLAVTGVAAAGAQSLPGDPFYGVKRTAEAVQLAVTGSDLAKGERHLEFAEHRLDEMQEMALTSGEADLERRVTRGFDDLDHEVREGRDLLTSAFRRVQGQGRTAEEQAPLRTLSRFGAAKSVTLQRLADQLPPPSRARAAASLALVAGVGADAEELLRLGTCGPACLAAASATGGATAGPCDCATGTAPGAGAPVGGAPDGGAPAGPGASDPGAPGPGPGSPISGQPGAADPAVPGQIPAAPGTLPGGTLPGGTLPGGTLPGGTLPSSGPVLPVPLPGTPVLPPGPTLTGPTAQSTTPTLAPTLPVELPTLAPLPR